VTGRRITVVASELLGRAGTGGAGTADSLLAVALGRHGHDVELLVASGRDIGELNDTWRDRYEAAGVRVRVLQPLPGVRPPYLAPALEVDKALQERVPGVVIVNDWRGLGHIAQRARLLGTALSDTAFVVHCHGPGRVLAEFAQKVPDTVARFAEEIGERTSVELADAVVSPSAWLLAWMREHRWPVPADARVIQYPRESAVLDEAPQRADADSPIRRLAFFGQLREGKGIRLFVDALADVGAVEVVFLGAESKRWTAETIRSRVPGARVETALTREAALAELLQPGTLAVMPSLLDNSPNAVSECLEHGIPFISTDTGGIPELVAPEDRDRVLCAPKSDALAAALRQALETGRFAPARGAAEPEAGVQEWLELVDGVRPRAARGGRPIGQVAVVATGDAAAGRAQRLIETTASVGVEVAVADSRRAGLEQTSADWIVFLDDDDEPDDDFLDRLVAAQARSGADIVTAAVRPAGEPGAVRLFLGDAKALGLLENHYGVLGLVRADLVAAEPLYPGAADPDWPLFVRLALNGAQIVSLSEPLSVHHGEPGAGSDVPGEGLDVLAAFEERAGRLHDLPQLAATLGAASRWAQPESPAAPRRDPSVLRRITWALFSRTSQ
jgi:glycosyltransferase involved in cell wall biosynthesis